jgi:hypothetical protein
MKRTARLAVAAAIALAPMSFAGVAHADPTLPCGPTDLACEQQYQAHWQNCYNQYGVAANHADSEAYTRCIDSFPLNPGWWCRGNPTLIGCKPSSSEPPKPSPTAQAQAPSTSIAQAPPTPPQAPPTQAAAVRPPKGLGASPQAVEAARAATPAEVDPANPPAPPTSVDFHQRVQSVIGSHRSNLDVVNGQAHPRHWDYIDHDQQQRPVIYNPMSEGMTFRYFYRGDYREVYVEAGSSAVLNITGVFPFTAVGDSYLTSGSFYGGSPPPVYRNVTVYLPAYDRYVQVDQVVPLGHDDSQPSGSQDTFMLDDSTLATGQATNPADGGQISVAKTQTLPNVGPMDDGKSLVDLAVPSHPNSGGMVGALVALGGGVLVIAAGLIAWLVIRRRKPSAAL